MECGSSLKKGVFKDDGRFLKGSSLKTWVFKDENSD